MGSSMTPLAPRDIPAPPPLRSARPGSLSPGVLVIVKVVLGVAGFAGFALLGAGGALLIKHLLTSDPGSGASTAHGTAITRTQPEPVSPAPAALPLVVPALPAQAVVSPPDASATSPSLPAPASATTAERGDAAIEAPARTARLSEPPTSPHTKGRPAHGVNSEGSATAAGADKASCLATLNAVTADLSLRSEPPTPQQLAILKRGCK